MSLDRPLAVRSANLVKKYGDFVAVNDVSMDVIQGECLGLLGPNGAGKSTLIRLLYGARHRDQGALSVFGQDPERAPGDVKKLVGVVPQENCLDDSLSVFENLWMFTRYHFIPKAEAIQRIDEVLTFFALAEKKHAPIRSLSGGMQRRLVFARALLHRPELLILDEPTTGLDPAVRHLLWSKVQELNQQKKTILVTTHYMEEAERLCDRVVIMYEGRVRAVGSPQELIEKHCPHMPQANLEAVFLHITGKELNPND